MEAFGLKLEKVTAIHSVSVCLSVSLSLCSSSFKQIAF